MFGSRRGQQWTVFRLLFMIGWVNKFSSVKCIFFQHSVVLKYSMNRQRTTKITPRELDNSTITQPSPRRPLHPQTEGAHKISSSTGGVGKSTSVKYVVKKLIWNM